MGKRFRTCSLDKPFMLPPSLHDWLPENQLARFVAEVIHYLDLSEIYGCYERKEGRGLAAYNPEMLTPLLLYGYAIGQSSSRRIEQATYDKRDVSLSGGRSGQHRKLPAAASGKLEWIICASAAVVSKGRTREVGACRD
jgi:transposase